MAYLDYEGLQHFKDKENEQVAPVESSNTSANAYEIGKYFWYEGNYCKAKTPIAVGDAFVQNTNFTVVKIGAEIEKKANTDGYYEAMTVGNAEQIVATEGVEDSTPYVFRKAGGGIAIGNREADTLIGGTIAWNQLFRGDGTTTLNEVVITISADKSSITLDGTATGTVYYPLRWYVPQSITGHVYFVDRNTNDNNVNVYNDSAGVATATDVPMSVGKATAQKTFYLRLQSGATYNMTIRPQLFDLTQMFGSTIADYIYGLEQANAGDGVAWFKNLFPNDYYAYDTGTLMSVNTSAHVTAGFNQWDEEWEIGNWNSTGTKGSASVISCKNPIMVLPNTTYYKNFPTGNYGLLYFDINMSYLGGNYGNNAGAFVTPKNCAYIVFTLNQTYGTTYNHDICVNISDPAKNGTYEPYDGNTYPLDSELTIRGIPKLDGNNNLYYDGDIYEADGTVTRKYGIVDLGTLTWADAGSYYASSQSIPNVKAPDSGGTKANAISTKYVVATSNGVSGGTEIGLGIRPSGALYVSNLGAAPTGILVYELASQTTEQAEPYAANQVVSGDGTEEYVDAGVQEETRDVSIPVGHNTVYQQDLRTKLQDAPDSPYEDGDYIMRRINGHNTYNKGNFAETNGSYPNMTAGNAEQLVSTIGIEDKTPYNFRTSGGSIDIGDRETDMVVGGTIAWNQYYIEDSYSISQNGITISFDKTTGITTVTVSDNVTGACQKQSAYDTNFEGHKLLVISDKPLAAGIEFYHPNFVGIRGSYSSPLNQMIIGAGVSSSASSKRVSFYVGASTAAGTYTYKLQWIDLTQMFGSTIADYVYSLEQTTAGAGVAWFKALFPKPYYDYNVGELISVNTSAHKMTGFNQIETAIKDTDWFIGNISSSGEIESTYVYCAYGKMIRVIPNTKYYMSFKNSVNQRRFAWYDSNGDFISRDSNPGLDDWFSATSPNNAYYMRWNINYDGATQVTQTIIDNLEICINLSWDGERDGEYEPYVEYNYPLDSSLELRGIPKLDSANNLYYDGDTYEADGTVTRRYGAIDLGTLDWLTLSGTTYYTVYFNNIIKVSPTVFCSKYQVVGRYVANAGIIAETNTGIIIKDEAATGNIINIHDSTYTTAEALKTSLSGVYLVYELAEPTTETAEPYQNPQIVNDFGTEEYVDYAESQGTRDVKVPVGHETVYAPNLRAKLETAPDSPQSDGDYIVRQTNGENQYVPLIIPQELPNTPGTDGTYRLQAVVSDGTATLSWVSAT